MIYGLMLTLIAKVWCNLIDRVQQYDGHGKAMDYRTRTLLSLKGNRAMISIASFSLCFCSSWDMRWTRADNHAVGFCVHRGRRAAAAVQQHKPLRPRERSLASREQQHPPSSCGHGEAQAQRGRPGNRGRAAQRGEPPG